MKYGLINVSRLAARHLRRRLRDLATDPEIEPTLFPHLIRPPEAQDYLNAALVRGLSLAEIVPELDRAFPARFDRIGFAIGGYTKGARSSKWRCRLFGTDVSISPSCRQLLEGRILDVGSDGNLVAIPTPTAAEARTALESPNNAAHANPLPARSPSQNDPFNP
jgi:hypothetical protein